MKSINTRRRVHFHSIRTGFKIAKAVFYLLIGLAGIFNIFFITAALLIAVARYSMDR